MINRYLLASSALILSIFSCWDSPVLADDTLDVPFDAIVYEQCLLSLLSSGQLEAIGGSSAIEFKANDTHGIPAQITADCNSPARLTVQPPVQTSGPPLSVTGTRDSFIRLAGNTAFNTEETVSPGLSNLAVGMYYDNQNPIPGGTYSFNVTVTATPN